MYANPEKVKRFLKGQASLEELAKEATTITYAHDGITLNFGEPDDDDEQEHHQFCHCEKCEGFDEDDDEIFAVTVSLADDRVPSEFQLSLFQE